MLILTPTQRRALKATSHALKPVVMIGEAGLSATVIKEIGVAITRHELIKIKVMNDDRELREAMLQEMCTVLAAAPVQHIGKTLTIYRPNAEKAKVVNKPLPNKRAAQNR